MVNTNQALLRLYHLSIESIIFVGHSNVVKIFRGDKGILREHRFEQFVFNHQQK